AMFQLWEMLEAEGIRVGFSTGRHLRSIRNFYDEKNTNRRGEICVCMVGTDVWERQGSDSARATGAEADPASAETDGYVLDEGWHRIISDQWDKSAVEAILSDIPEATMQDQQWQSPYKSSYFLEENAEQRVREIEERLAEKGLRAKVVYSASRFLDLLPYRSGKGEAVKYVAERLELSPNQVITCGDTGNDLDMMRPELGFRSIAVGNAAPELKAFEAPHVYHAKADFSAGIIEGLKHHGWL
ncbi:MAG: HAD-IIB family hydrolase, partial [Planctomycetota bacterium]